MPAASENGASEENRQWLYQVSVSGTITSEFLRISLHLISTRPGTLKENSFGKANKKDIWIESFRENRDLSFTRKSLLGSASAVSPQESHQRGFPLYKTIIVELKNARVALFILRLRLKKLIIIFNDN